MTQMPVSTGMLPDRLRRPHELSAARAFGLLLVLVLSAACTPAAPSVGARPAGSSPSATGPAVAAVATALPTWVARWQSYTEPTLGYSLAFPEDADFTSGASKAGVYTARLQFRIPGLEGYQGMVLRVEPNPERRGIEQVVQELYRRNLLADPPPDLLQQLSSVTVAGLSGVQLGQGGDFSLVIPYEDYVYIIAPGHDLAATAIDPQALALFYQVLSTLRFAP